MSPGDHLQVPRQHGLFNHHGIDLGDGTVAHYLEGREILKSSIQEFCAGENYSVVIHKNASTKDLTLSRANSRIGEQNYNLLFNNCEHFANWCKTGTHRSNQIEDLIKNSSLGSIAVAQYIPALLFTGVNLLLKKGLTNESSRQKAKHARKELERLRNNLIRKLESTLEEIENWLTANEARKSSQEQSQVKETLLLKGQNLADQLTRIENVEAQITSLLNKAEAKN